MDLDHEGLELGTRENFHLYEIAVVVDLRLLFDSLLRLRAEEGRFEAVRPRTVPPEDGNMAVRVLGNIEKALIAISVLKRIGVVF